MFDILAKHKNQDHFFLMPNNSFNEEAFDIPDLPGVFYVFKLAEDRVRMVYVGRSDNTKLKKSSNMMLRSSVIKFVKDVAQPQLKKDKKIDGLDVYWVVTMDKNHEELPSYVEGVILQIHYDHYGSLPDWNK
jgi:hypothetical protein